MLWFAVHPPWLSLEAYCATLQLRDARPVALVSEHRITAANDAAQRAGVQPGFKRATALALVADLQLGQADDARDAQAQLALVHAALSFTPSVAVDGHSVLLEVQSCLRYFGGAAALLARLRDALAPLGHRVQIAAAPTALGAALLARWRDDLALGAHATDVRALRDLLDDAPVWLLGPGREHWEALQGMGLHRLSDLRHLPRSGLARRFGAGLLDDLDRARGTRADPRVWLTAPERFDSGVELAMRAEHTEQVLHGAAVLLARLVAWGQARQARVAAFSLRMKHEPAGPPQGRIPDGAGRRCSSEPAAAESSLLRIELAEPSLDAAHLQLLLRERLAQVQLPAPTLELQIACDELVHASAPNRELFPSRQAGQGGLVRLLEHLRARLGDAQVQQLQAVADHRPEGASRSVTALDGTRARRARGVAAAAPTAQGRASASTSPPRTADVSPLPLARPVWLLPDPLPLAERGALPLLDGAPLQLLAGPERIESGWWDSAPAVRDYFIAQAADRSLVWIYRSRLPAADEQQPLWFLHGRYG